MNVVIVGYKRIQEYFVWHFYSGCFAFKGFKSFINKKTAMNV